MCKSLQDTSPCEQTGKQISLMLLMLQRVTQESYLDVVCRCWRGCVCVCARAAAVVSRCLWEWPITRIRLVLYHRPARATVCTFPMKLTSFFSFLFFFPLPRQQVEGVFKESHEEWWEDVSKWGDRDQRTSPPFTTRWIRRASPDTLNISAYYYYYYYCTLSPCLHQRFKQNKKRKMRCLLILTSGSSHKKKHSVPFFCFYDAESS